MVLALILVSRGATGEPLIFRPLLADPHESVIHFRVESFRQDFRFGSDITDPASHGGWENGRRGVGFDLGGGKYFRLPIGERLFGHSGPWKRYRVIASALASSSFDRIHAELITTSDYQFGGGFEAQWSGEGNASRGVTAFDVPVVTTRTQILHRSSHLGDEVIGQSRFGANQTGPGAGLGLSDVPAIKRTVISHEVLQQSASVEWSPDAAHLSTLRGYASGEWMAGISTRKPWRRRSPAYQLGAEWRSLGNALELPDPGSGRLRRALGGDRVGTGWFAAFDLRFARPFNFASCDNPSGEDEVWTPSLWTPCPCGREFRRYAGTWRGMAGLSLFSPRARRTDGPVSGETVLALEWSHGYSWHGPFIDSRRETHPRWYVVPSLTTHF